MINPKLKEALLKWHKTSFRQRASEEDQNPHEYTHHNSERIAALEEIRKIVERGEFNQLAM